MVCLSTRYHHVAQIGLELAPCKSPTCPTTNSLYTCLHFPSVSIIEIIFLPSKNSLHILRNNKERFISNNTHLALANAQRESGLKQKNLPTYTCLRLMHCTCAVILKCFSVMAPSHTLSSLKRQESVSAELALLLAICYAG